MEDTYRSQFRLPYPLYEKLKAAAEHSGRSLNAELVARLQNSFEGVAVHGLDEDGLLKVRDMVIQALYDDFVKRGKM